MTNEEFKLLTDKSITRIKSLMVRKGDEYSGESDRLENFKRAAAMAGIDPAEALYHMVNKHWTSISMMMEYAPDKFSMKQWREKIDDVIVYMFLLLATLEDMGIE